MTDLQKEDLNILIWLDKVCKQHDLSYILDAGTLLGALRHKGFIPWDDDADIAMLRSDYEKFEQTMIKLLPDKENGYRYQSRLLDKYYAHEFAKVRSDKLDIKEVVSKTQKGYSGAWVDIFPFDNVPDDLLLREKQFKKLIKLNRAITLLLLMQPTDKDKGLKKLIKSVIIFINEKTYKINPIVSILLKLRKKEIQRYNNEKTKDVANLAFTFNTTIQICKSSVTSRESFIDLAEYQFEGQLFQGPKDYDAYLTNLYGKYMDLPPESERKVHRLI